MTKALRWILVTVMVASPFAYVGVAQMAVAHAQAAGQCDDCGPVQDGNNSGRNSQSGTAKSGDAVGGQVTGVVSSGAASVDARNNTTDSSATSGDASASNTGSTFTGLVQTDDGNINLADANGQCDDCGPIQDGSNRSNANQAANASTGDGVAGQITGVVTAAGGSASVVAANTTLRSDAQTGDADSSNDYRAFTGLVQTDDGDINLADAFGRCDDCGPIQDGTNSSTGNQNATASTGDGVVGQVNGIVAGGRTSLDANNHTEDSSATSGDADAENTQTAFTGLVQTDDGNINLADAFGRCDDCAPVQDGSNRQTLTQNATATSGDAIAGEVSGIVTSAGGSASVVVANTTLRTDSTSGDTTFDNNDAGFVGLGQTDGGNFNLDV